MLTEIECVSSRSHTCFFPASCENFFPASCEKASLSLHTQPLVLNILHHLQWLQPGYDCLYVG